MKIYITNNYDTRIENVTPALLGGFYVAYCSSQGFQLQGQP